MLKINEIFYSIQGESTQMGRPCIFIRLTGCKLRCTYCDTQYAYHEGQDMSFDTILSQIRRYPCRLVEVTGGEPMEQKNTPEFLALLLREGYEVLLETDGVEDLSRVPLGVRIIMDVKTPGSRMSNPKSERHLAQLRAGDEVKFVVCDRQDYEFARDFIRKHEIQAKPLTILISPVLPAQDISWLAETILADGLNARMQIQMHKQIWGDKRGV